MQNGAWNKQDALGKKSKIFDDWVARPGPALLIYIYNIFNL